MTPLEIGLTVAGALALLFMAAWIGFDEGQRRAMRDVDDLFEAAKTLGAYGQVLRMESASTGVAVEDLIERDRRHGGAL